MAAPGIIDPTKAGQYPVILSDALLGKPSKETYTGVRYNHRPALSSDTAPHTARLKKSGKDDSYNLGFDDQGNKYQYNGIRTSDDGNYVLIFDPARKAFVLHRVDSTFHMNLTRTPTDSNAESLRKQFPHLEVKSSAPTKGQKGKGAAKAGTGKTTAGKAKDVSKPVEDSKTASKPVALTLPDPNAVSSTSPPSHQSEKKQEATAEPEKKPKRRALSPVESEEEEDDDDDGGLTVEYPGGNPSAFQPPSGFSPAFPVAVTRRFSEFAKDIQQGSEEDEFDDNDNNNNRMMGGYEFKEESEEEGYEEGDEYDGEEEEEEPTQQLPPSHPVKNLEVPVAVEPDRYTFDDGDDSDADANQDAMDLEAELDREFDKVVNGGNDSDSSVSEEE
ncbi:hypothetical protein VTI74DRAFT_3829 [Chaetomium olivicolor]